MLRASSKRRREARACCTPDWISAASVSHVPAEQGVAAEQILEGMQPLLAPPVEIVLLTHGAPAERAALERALATSPS
jgi:hypothetical protein